MRTWKLETENEIKKIIDNIIEKIFEKENMETLSNYEKRKIIYDYIVENYEYDIEYYIKIIKSNLYKTKIKRDLCEEFFIVLTTNKGICNSLSQMYKIILEKVGIPSYCINCTIKFLNYFVPHQLNIVYNKETNTFSFDDVALGIIKQQKDTYFDYDNPQELEEQQGIKPLYDDNIWFIIPEDLTDCLMKRETQDSQIQIYKNEFKNNQDLINNGIKIKSSKSKLEKTKTL